MTFSRTLISLAVLALVSVPMTAFAQVDDDSEDAPPKKKAGKKAAVAEEEDDDEGAPKPAGAAAPKAAPGAASGAAAAPVDSDDAKPSVMFGIERFAGLGYAVASPNDGDASASLTLVNLGGINLNPYAVTRSALDFRVGDQIWLGGSLGFSHFSAGASSGGESKDIGSVTLYTLTPRASYQVDLGPDLVLFPRAGVVIAGGSGKFGGGDNKASLFSLGLSLEGMLAYRFTKTFNVLAGLSLERTLSASVTTGDGDSSKSSDVKGSFTSVQLWLGLGGWK